MNVTTVPVENQPPIQTKSQPLQPFFRGSMPLPPGINHATNPVNGQMISAKALREFKEAAALMLSDHEKTFHDWGLINAVRQSRLKVPLHVTLRIYFPTEWKRDLDGVLKYCIDAAFNRIDLNDNQVVRIEADKLVDRVEPRVEIEISCLLSR